MRMSMECPLVTVVVPVYNVREYVADCIRSVLNQTYPNIECICVDDGSTDGSSDVLDGFKDDSRMVVVRQENGGVSVARNRALELARGDYMTFLDAADLFCADFIEKAVADFAADPNLDLWVGQVVKVDENNVPFDDQPGRPPVCDTENVLDDFLHFHGRHYLFSICPKVYRAAVIRENGIRFRVGMKNGEDSLFVTKVYSFTRKGRITNAEVYRRRMRGGSAVGTPWASQVPDSLEAIVDLIEFARQSSSPDSVYRAIAQRALARLGAMPVAA